MKSNRIKRLVDDIKVLRAMTGLLNFVENPSPKLNYQLSQREKELLKKVTGVKI